MKNSVRNIVLFVSASSFLPLRMLADVSGTNPHPQQAVVRLIDVIRAILGF